MTAAVGDSAAAGMKLKSKSGWSDNGNGTDDFGFSALPGGYRWSDGNFNYVGSNGFWWSATENDVVPWHECGYGSVRGKFVQLEQCVLCTLRSELSALVRRAIARLIENV